MVGGGTRRRNSPSVSSEAGHRLSRPDLEDKASLLDSHIHTSCLHWSILANGYGSWCSGLGHSLRSSGAGHMASRKKHIQAHDVLHSAS